MGDIVVRHSIESLCELRESLIVKVNQLYQLDSEIDMILDSLDGHSPIDVRDRLPYGDCRVEKGVDQCLWAYVVKLYELHKYMLCTDYDKLQKDIAEYRTPDFTFENVTAWVDGLKGLIYCNIQTLVKQVFESITSGIYYTGGTGYRGVKKKRNNNGIDKMFILRTWDHYLTRGRPTITDDLEKVCYLLSGETLPDVTAKQIMAQKETLEYKCEYFSLKVCKNGNTHYTLADSIRDKLNYYGSGRSVFGENIKIKVFER